MKLGMRACVVVILSFGFAGCDAKLRQPGGNVPAKAPVLSPPLPEIPTPTKPPAIVIPGDVEFTTQIPLEVQRQLDDFGKLDFEDQKTLMSYPHPKVRRETLNKWVLYEFAINGGRRADVLEVACRSLGDPHPEVRMQALEVLSFGGEQSTPAVSQIVALLDDPNVSVQRRTIDTLIRLGPIAAPAVPRLVHIQQDGTLDAQVVFLLGRIGPTAQPAVPHIVHMLNHGNDPRAAGEALGLIGAEPELLAALGSDNDEIVRAAAVGARNLKVTSPELAQQLIRIAERTGDPRLLVEIADALGNLRPMKPEIVVTLGKLAQHADASTRRRALQALGTTEPQLPEAVPVLEAALKDPDESVRTEAGKSLAAYGANPEDRLKRMFEQIVREDGMPFTMSSESLLPQVDDYAPILIGWTKDAERADQERSLALYCLGAVCKWSKVDEKWKMAAIGLAEATLKDPQSTPTMLAAAAYTMTELKYLSSEYREQLIRAADGATITGLRSECIFKLREHATPEAAAVLKRALDSQNPLLIIRALTALEGIKEAGDLALPSILLIAAKPKSEYRSAALQAVAAVNTRPELTVPVLQSLAEDPSESIRESARDAWAVVVAKHQLDPQGVIDRIRPDLQSKVDRFDRATAAFTCRHLGPLAAPLVPELSACLRRADKGDARPFIVALAAIGPDASSAAPLVVDVLRSGQDEGECLDAIQAMKTAPGFALLVPSLLNKLYLRQSVLKTLAVLGEEAAPAIPAIVSVLHSPDSFEQSIALETLAALGPVAKSAAPEVAKLLTDKHEEFVRKDAATALLAIDPDAARAAGVVQPE